MPQNKLRRNTNFNEQNELPGIPGYRTRQGRSGYDPLDTSREAAHMEGTFYRNLFTLRLRTHNYFYLVLMFIFGVIPLGFLIYLVIMLVSENVQMGPASSWILLIFPLIFVAFTGSLTLNFLLSILEMAKVIPLLDRNLPKQVKERKKKMPKRRKDFR